MSEYWVSKGKYWCQYCKVFIADDKPSRQHHESGLRHKGNLERFIRDIYKKGMQKEKDQADEDREMRAINAAAARAMGQAPEASTSRTPIAPKKNTGSSSSNPYSNYSTAASLGFDDPDAERLAAEKEKRAQEGVAGDWSIVMPTKRKAPPPLEDDSPKQTPAERVPDSEKQHISFSYLKEKSLPTDDDDLGNLEIKVKAPKVQKSTNALDKAVLQAKSQAPPNSAVLSAPSSAASKGKFKAIVAQEPEEETPEEQEARNQAAWDLIAPPEDAKPETQSSEAAPLVPLFKKRKTNAKPRQKSP